MCRVVRIVLFCFCVLCVMLSVNNNANQSVLVSTFAVFLIVIVCVESCVLCFSVFVYCV